MSFSPVPSDSGYGTESPGGRFHISKEGPTLSRSPKALDSPQNISPGSVIIPDLFESFLSRIPSVNPHYQAVAEDSINWISRICSYTETERRRLHKADFAYFAAVAYPEATSERLRVLTDWFNWVFAFDDQLDDGLVPNNQAKEYIAGMQAVLENEDYNRGLVQQEQPSRYVLKKIWDALQQDSEYNAEARWRWLHRMITYFSALRDSIGFEPSAELDETIKRYINYRFYSVAVLPILSFTEYARGLQLPDHVFQNSAMIEIERIGVELQMLANDCVSYHRERARQRPATPDAFDLGCPHNIIHLLRHHGLSEQDAYDRVHVLIRNSYRKWYLAHAHLPTWGEEVDRQVHQYIRGIQDVALANLHWSFHSERYFGKNRRKVRITRVVEISPSGSDWLPSVVPKTEAEASKRT